MKTSLPIGGIPLYELEKIQAKKIPIYTTTYLGTYLPDDYSEGSGSHCGVDISTSQYKENQPDCLAVADGVIFKADENSTSSGKHIVIEHKNVPHPSIEGESTTLYSCYLHLSSINVQKGDTVSAGQKIGVTGKTGQSTAEHLHFQIDASDAPFHPYWPFTWKESSDAGLDFMSAVNKGLNKEKAAQYTIHPMLYIQKHLNGTSETEVPPTNTAEVTPSEPPTEILNTEVKPENIVPTETASVSPSTSLIFSDIPETHPFYTSTKALSQGKIIGGYSNGSFGVDDPITRGQILKILMLAFKITLTTDTSNIPFSDIKADDWWTSYILTAVQGGFASGYSDGTFQPEKTVNRAEALKFLCGVAKITPSIASTSFTDVPADAWFYDYARVAEEKKLIDFTGNLFEGSKVLTRGECAEMIYRLQQSL